MGDFWPEERYNVTFKRITLAALLSTDFGGGVGEELKQGG